MGKKVLVILGDGFEEIEALAPVDILRRGDVVVETASVSNVLRVTGSHGIAVEADGLLKDCLPEDYAMVILPGGPGVNNLMKCDGIFPIIIAIYKQGGWLASICAGPRVLAKAGVLRGRRITAYPTEKEALLPHVGEYVEEGVVVDGKVITACGAGYAVPFGLTLLEKLKDAEMASLVGAKMLVQ
jgi:4-methyl-5(b-hydroxyethyl)-thiazole monophosphate biosynthesis